jgi:RimJ/RimL family protein N-acetyltransferase
MQNSKVKVKLREAKRSDIELILAWRNNPLVWQGSYTQAKENRPLTWQEHWKWWQNNTARKIFIIKLVNGENTQRDVGYLSISNLNKTPEFSISIGEVSLWGQGVGKEALKLGIKWLKEHGYKKVSASILKNNERSLKLFTSLGFKIMGELRKDEWVVKLCLS